MFFSSLLIFFLIINLKGEKRLPLIYILITNEGEHLLIFNNHFLLAFHVLCPILNNVAHHFSFDLSQLFEY